MDDNAAAADVDRYKYTADESRLLKFLKDQSVENIAKANSDYHFAKDPLWKSRTMRMMIITMTSI
jgi:hypothetical protein